MIKETDAWENVFEVVPLPVASYPHPGGHGTAGPPLKLPPSLK